MTDPTFRDMQRCCQSELSKRNYVYPKLVEVGKLTEAKAAKEKLLMAACAEHFRKLADEEDAKGRLL